MDNQSSAASTEPQNSQPTKPPGGMKTIQPLNPNLSQELEQAKQNSLNPAPAQQASPNLAPNSAANQASSIPKTAPDVSKIYPDPVPSLGASPHMTEKDGLGQATTNTEFTFGRGKYIGMKIFWYQLVYGVIFFLLLFCLQRTIKNSTALILLELVGEVGVLIIPFYVLKKESITKYFWMGVLGGGFQTLLLVIALLIVTLVITATTKATLATIIIVYLALVVVAYFIDKLAYGISFFLRAKLGETVIMIIDLIILVLLVVGLATSAVRLFHYYHHSSVPTTTVKTPISTNETPNYKDSQLGFRIYIPQGWTETAPTSSTENGSTIYDYSWSDPQDDGITISYVKPFSGTLQSAENGLITNAEHLESGVKIISSKNVTLDNKPALYFETNWSDFTSNPNYQFSQTLVEMYNSGVYSIRGVSIGQNALSEVGTIRNTLYSFSPN